MRSFIFLLTTTALLGTAACSQAETPAPAEAEAETVMAAPANPAVATVAPAAAQDALPQLTGSYWTARQALIAQGYTPVNLVSEGQRVCVAEMEQEREISGACPSREEVLSEIEDCAGTGLGQCKAIWRSPAGRNVTIITVDSPQPGVISTIEWSTGDDAQGMGQD